MNAFQKHLGTPLFIAFFFIFLLAVMVKSVAGEFDFSDWLNRFAIIALAFLILLAWYFKKELSKDLEYRQREHDELETWIKRIENHEITTTSEMQQTAPGIMKNNLLRFYPNGIGIPEYQNRPVVITTSDLLTYIQNQINEKFDGSKISRFGSSITGIALFCTFALIAPAVIEIGQSLSPQTKNVASAESVGSQQPKITGGSNAQLKSAIVSIGGKFAISASGVLLAVCLAWELEKRRKNFLSKIDGTIKKLRGISCVREELDLVIQLDQLHHVSESLEAHKDNLLKQEAIIDAVKTLSSIEVSLKSLGEEVVTQMQDMISKSIGESLERLLDQQKTAMDEVAKNIATVVADGLNNHMSKLLSSITGQLDQISSSINQKGDSQFTEAITQLTEAISGKISGGADTLNKSLEQFALSMPDLIAGLKVASEEMKSGSRLALESQQNGQDNLVESLNQAIKNIVVATNGISGGIADGGKALHDNYELIRTAMTKMTDEVFGSVEDLRATLTEVQTAGRVLNESSDKVKPVYKNLEDAASKLKSTSDDFTRVSSALINAPNSFKDSFIKADEVVKNQTLQLEKQVSQWQKLLGDITVASRQINVESQESYSRSADTVKGAFNALSNFTDSIEGLREELSELLKKISKV